MFKIFRGFLCNKYRDKGMFYKNNREIINEIKYNEMLEKLKQGAKLIDTRTKQEYLEGHFDSAILLPYFEISKRIESIVPDKEQVIIVYCQNGGRSKKAYKILKDMGYDNIYNLKGGREGVLE